MTEGLIDRIKAGYGPWLHCDGRQVYEIL